MRAYPNERLIRVGGYLSTLIYIISSFFKITAGVQFQSIALYADGLNSTSDILATIIILVGLSLAKKPKDAEHPYGHYRIEQIATLIASLIMFIIGFQTCLQGIQKLFVPALPTPNITAAIVALISCLLICVSAICNHLIAKKTHSDSANVIAKNNMSDALTAFGTFVAIFATQWNLPIIDPIASLLIAFVIFKTAFTIFQQASNKLIDGFDLQKLELYRTLLLKNPDIKAVVDIRGRFLGNLPILDITIAVDGSKTITEGHIIADQVELALKLTYNIEYAHVHIEPYYDPTIPDTIT